MPEKNIGEILEEIEKTEPKASQKNKVSKKISLALAGAALVGSVMWSIFYLGKLS